MAGIVISCVLDNQPKFLMQCWNWFASLDAVGARQRAEIVIHHTSTVDEDDVMFFKSLGARMERIEPFSVGGGNAAYCNKIRQLESAVLRGADYIILCDTDLLFTSCPTRYALGDAVRAKIVDLPNPPLAICQRIAERAGFGRDFPLTQTDFSPEDLTLAYNFNGGFYVLPTTAIEVLRTAWPKWAKFCLDQGDVLDRWLHHSDQLGFALAILETRLSVMPLERGSNFPTHFKVAYYTTAEPETISAFHYHRCLDAAGFVQYVGVPWIDFQITAANDAISPFRRVTFNNKIFVDFRYAMHTELSGGSRQTCDSQKKDVVDERKKS